MSKYDQIQWLVQRNLTSRSDVNAVKEACKKTGVGFVPIDVIPFSRELPFFDRSKHVITYGSTTFNDIAMADDKLRKGIFFNPETFSIENYLMRWEDCMLNHKAEVTTFDTLIREKKYANDTMLFIRPDDDTKSFAGDVIRYDEIVLWYEKLLGLNNSNLTGDTKIIASPPRNIQYEWRLWIVKGNVVAASKYRECFRLKKETGCPPEVVAFAEERCREYTPHAVFVMDVCFSDNEYFIVECGCMNGAGFYSADIGKIITAVTEYFYAEVTKE